MEKFCLALCLILTLSLKTLGESSNTFWNETNVDELKKELLKNYDRLNRPEDFQAVTKCQLAITIINMNLNEKKGILETHAWMRMNWNDSKMKWDPTKHSNITQLNVAPDEVWTPDISIYNSAEENLVEHFAKTNKLIYPTGMVLWVPTSTFSSYCKMNLKFWPFDEQKCEIKIGSWTFSALQLDLDFDKANPIDTTYYNNLEWEIVSKDVEKHQTFYNCCPEPYTDITFYLTLKRNSPMFKAIAIVPALVVVFLTLSSFWLPPQAGEKLLLNGVACIMVCLFLMYLSKLLPIIATTSLIVTFYSNTLYLLCASFIISVIVINLSRNQKGSPLPKSLKKNILEGFIGKCLSASSDSNESIKEDQIEKVLGENNVNGDYHVAVHTPTTANNTKSHLIQSEWIRLAVIIDRIAFIIYLIIFILMGFIQFV